MAEATTPVVEAILEPDLPIVEIRTTTCGFGPSQLMARLPPPTHDFDRLLRLTPRYLFDELMADLTSGHNVRATVYLECGSMWAGPTARRH